MHGQTFIKHINKLPASNNFLSSAYATLKHSAFSSSFALPTYSPSKTTLKPIFGASQPARFWRNFWFDFCQVFSQLQLILVYGCRLHRFLELMLLRHYWPNFWSTLELSVCRHATTLLSVITRLSQLSLTMTHTASTTFVHLFAFQVLVSNTKVHETGLLIVFTPSDVKYNVNIDRVICAANSVSGLLHQVALSMSS